MNETNPQQRINEQMRKPIKLNSKETKLMTYEEVHKYYSKYIYKMVSNYCVNKPQISYFEDYLQEAYIGLYNAYLNYDINKNILFKTLLCRYVKNKLYDFLLKNIEETGVCSLERLKETYLKNLKHADNINSEDLVISNENISNTYEMKALIEKSLDNYTSNNKNANRDKNIILDIINGMSQTEIAQKLHMTRANISYIFRNFCEEFMYQYETVI